MSRRKRHLSAEERAIWETVARQARPLDPKIGRKIRSPASDIETKKTGTGPKNTAQERSVSPFRIGEKVDHRRSNDLIPALGQQLRDSAVQMDTKSFGRLKRGKLKPEARIDLHGMTQAEAHPALIGFILRSQAEGKRLVLVITGKGRMRDEVPPFPARQGILRHNVPQWLRMAPIGQQVLQLAPAHIRHGGEGAYYVYLRRAR